MFMSLIYSMTSDTAWEYNIQRYTRTLQCYAHLNSITGHDRDPGAYDAVLRVEQGTHSVAWLVEVQRRRNATLDWGERGEAQDDRENIAGRETAKVAPG